MFPTATKHCPTMNGVLESGIELSSLQDAIPGGFHSSGEAKSSWSAEFALVRPTQLSATPRAKHRFSC
jgi:hypothetical protein